VRPLRAALMSVIGFVPPLDAGAAGGFHGR